MAVKITRVQTDDRQINQLQSNIAGAIERLFTTTLGSFLASLTGCSTTPIGLAKWQMAASTGQVTLSLPILSATSNTTSASLVGIPQEIWPASPQTVLMLIQNNGTTAVLPATITQTGLFTLKADLTVTGATGFTASAAKGIGSCNITYLVGL